MASTDLGMNFNMCKWEFDVTEASVLPILYEFAGQALQLQMALHIAKSNYTASWTAPGV